VKNKEATIVTFYSYKGGVGRSMAVANIAWLLAEGSKLKVLVVDWDLEAPGLHRFFGMKDEDISKGLIEVLNDYKELLRKETGSLPEKLVDLRKYVQPVKAFSDGGSISILAAGRQEDAAAYAATINAFSWEEFYAKWHGFGFIEHLKQQLRTFDETDIVLVDSRTGVTDIGGICTLQLPDVVVILFAMNDQNIVGAKSVAERISKKAGELEGRDGPPILILRPARVERSSGNQDKKLEWQAKATRQLGEYFSDRDAETVIAKKNIPYVSDFSYGETPLAVVKDRLGDMTDSFKDLAASIKRIADKANGKSRPLEAHRSAFARSLVRFLQFRARLFLSRRRNVYLLTGLLVLFLFAVAGFSLIKIRELNRTSLALQQENGNLQSERKLRNKEIENLQKQVNNHGAQITIQIADESQRDKADQLVAALRLEGFCVANDIEPVKPAELPPQTQVKYFYPEDENEADFILGLIREKTGIANADSKIDLNERQDYEDHRFFEIWFKTGAF
jgi:MinD-like ATPase involved in chromosome partitioning or flagellar assembly/cell division protein FtsB